MWVNAEAVDCSSWTLLSCNLYTISPLGLGRFVFYSIRGTVRWKGTRNTGYEGELATRSRGDPILPRVVTTYLPRVLGDDIGPPKHCARLVFDYMSKLARKLRLRGTVWSFLIITSLIFRSKYKVAYSGPVGTANAFYFRPRAAHGSSTPTIIITSIIRDFVEIRR